VPELNKKSQAVESELHSLETAAVDQARYLQLAESLEGFRIKLRERAKTLDVCERPADFAAAREGGARCRRQPNHPSLDPDSANRP
jgi:hypothetical protein